MSRFSLCLYFTRTRKRIHKYNRNFNLIRKESSNIFEPPSSSSFYSSFSSRNLTSNKPISLSTSANKTWRFDEFYHLILFIGNVNTFQHHYYFHHLQDKDVTLINNEKREYDAVLFDVLKVSADEIAVSSQNKSFLCCSLFLTFVNVCVDEKSLFKLQPYHITI